MIIDLDVTFTAEEETPTEGEAPPAEGDTQSVKEGGMLAFYVPTALFWSVTENTLHY